MPRQIIATPDAPGSPLFSQAVAAGPFVLVSGTVGIDPSTGSMAGETIQEQTRQALTNCETILRAAGAGLDDVVEVGVLLADPADFAGFNEEWARWFPSDPPAVRRQAGRGRARAPRVDPHDGVHRLSPSGVPGRGTSPDTTTGPDLREQIRARSVGLTVCWFRT